MAQLMIQPVALKANQTVRSSPRTFNGQPIALRRLPHVARGRRSTVVVRAEDFDTFLIDVANKFEKLPDNKKPAVVGWTVAAVAGLVTIEWFVNLPLFNVLLGFPAQLLGVVTALNLGMRYYIDKEGKPMDDLEGLVNKVSSQLPGLGK